MKRCAACQRDYPDHLDVCPEDGAPLQLPSRWPVGALVRGQYEILAPLGEDSVSVVCKARDLSLGELRAIRALRPEFARRASLVRQFKQLAVIAPRLQHPAIVRVEAAEDADDGRPFLVMEHVEGRDLGTALGLEAPFNAARACSIARQVAGALDVAHRLGLVHRNLSSANVRLVAAPGGERVKVLGFGMARVIESCLYDPHSSRSSLGPAGLVIGTPQYASPEQAAGKLDADLDARSDLYSLGVLLYEMLTSRLPFPASPSGPWDPEDTRDLGALLAHLDRAPEPLDGAPQIPGRLAALVEKLLEKKRELRPATAQAVIEELDAITNDLAPSALEIHWEMGEPLRAPVALVTAPATLTIPEGGPAIESAVAPGGGSTMASVVDGNRGETEEPPAVPAGSVGPIGEIPLSATPPAPEATSPAGLEIRRVRAYSTLFKPPAPAGRWRRVLKVAVALAAVPVAVWCFVVYRPRLARSTINELIERYGPAQKPDTPQPKAEQPPAPSPRHRAGSAGAAKTGRVSALAPARVSRPAPHGTVDPALVQASVAEGDGFFELGDYDRAIAVYERPLKIDPAIRVLQQRVERAKKARAAEEKYLNQ